MCTQGSVACAIVLQFQRAANITRSGRRQVLELFLGATSRKPDAALAVGVALVSPRSGALLFACHSFHVPFGWPLSACKNCMAPD
jgi:hypothetical protein